MMSLSVPADNSGLSLGTLLVLITKVGQTIALCIKARGGKSGLRRAGCQVTPGRCEPTESATENIPPACVNFVNRVGKGEMVR